YIITPLSKASFAGMVHLARFAGLPWDCIITAENAKRYKPAPEVYCTAIELLGFSPGQIMMVAAHNYDLAAARTHGMRTAFVPRPTEYGSAQTTDLTPEGDWDVVAKDMEDLARILGACGRWRSDSPTLGTHFGGHVDGHAHPMRHPPRWHRPRASPRSDRGGTRRENRRGAAAIASVDGERSHRRLEPVHRAARSDRCARSP